MAALESSQAKGSPFTVFQKVPSNVWLELGWFVVKGPYLAVQTEHFTGGKNIND
jgi:hypothetical protein